MSEERDNVIMWSISEKEEIFTRLQLLEENIAKIRKILNKITKLIIE